MPYKTAARSDYELRTISGGSSLQEVPSARYTEASAGRGFDRVLADQPFRPTMIGAAVLKRILHQILVCVLLSLNHSGTTLSSDTRVHYLLRKAHPYFPPETALSGGTGPLSVG
jgi:hypothetical protein